MQISPPNYTLQTYQTDTRACSNKKIYIPSLKSTRPHHRDAFRKKRLSSSSTTASSTTDSFTTASTRNSRLQKNNQKYNKTKIQNKKYSSTSSKNLKLSRHQLPNILNELYLIKQYKKSPNMIEKLLKLITLYGEQHNQIHNKRVIECMEHHHNHQNSDLKDYFQEILHDKILTPQVLSSLNQIYDLKIKPTQQQKKQFDKKLLTSNITMSGLFNHPDPTKKQYQLMSPRQFETSFNLLRYLIDSIGTLQAAFVTKDDIKEKDFINTTGFSSLTNLLNFHDNTNEFDQNVKYQLTDKQKKEIEKQIRLENSDINNITEQDINNKHHKNQWSLINFLSTYYYIYMHHVLKKSKLLHTGAGLDKKLTSTTHEEKQKYHKYQSMISQIGGVTLQALPKLLEIGLKFIA